jgi:DNA repair protein RecO (recombination protein O)
MPARESEALILRTYPYREADLVVSFFTRDRGKLRGIARGVRRPKSRYGAGLERLAHVRISYFYKHTQDLVRVDRAEPVSPPLVMLADYPCSVALDYIAEVAEGMLPEHEPNDAYFRLVSLAVETAFKGLSEHESDDAAGVPPWMSRIMTYFALWTVKLGGWLPPLDVCLETGETIGPDEPAWFDRNHDGLLSFDVRTEMSSILSPASRELARKMLRRSLADLENDDWTPETGQDLRRFLNQRLESHLEKRLRTLRLLAAL